MKFPSGPHYKCGKIVFITSLFKKSESCILQIRGMCCLNHYCIMPCPFTGRKMFCTTGPNFLIQPKNLTAFSASSKTFVPAQKPILLNANHLFVQHKMTNTMCKQMFGPTKKIGPAQNILRSVKGQGISVFLYHIPFFNRCGK